MNNATTELVKAKNSLARIMKHPESVGLTMNQSLDVDSLSTLKELLSQKPVIIQIQTLNVNLVSKIWVAIEAIDNALTCMNGSMESVCNNAITEGTTYKALKKKFDVTYLTELLKRTDGNIAKAERMAGFSTNVIKNKMERLNMTIQG